MYTINPKKPLNYYNRILAYNPTQNIKGNQKKIPNSSKGDIRRGKIKEIIEIIRKWGELVHKAVSEKRKQRAIW